MAGPTNLNLNDNAPVAPAGARLGKWQAGTAYPDPFNPTIPCRDASVYFFGVGVLYGAGAPSTLAEDGDFYINITNGDLYQQTNNGASPPVSSWGSPIGNIKGGGARADVVLTTGSLATNAIETGTVALGKGFSLVHLTVSCKCRVILYATAAARTADAGARPPDGSGYIPQPTPGTDHGILADFYLSNPAKLSWLCSPEADASNGDDPAVANIYYSVTNLDTTQAITVTFKRRLTEV